MSKMFKIILALAVLLIVAGGIYFWFFHESTEFPVDATAESSDTLPTGSDASDDSLDKDMAAMEAQMDAFDADTASIDASISDEPIEQTSL